MKSRYEEKCGGCHEYWTDACGERCGGCGFCQRYEDHEGCYAKLLAELVELKAEIETKIAMDAVSEEGLIQ